MNTWPENKRRALTQTQHEEWQRWANFHDSEEQWRDVPIVKEQP